MHCPGSIWIKSPFLTGTSRRKSSHLPLPIISSSSALSFALCPMTSVMPSGASRIYQHSVLPKSHFHSFRHRCHRGAPCMLRSSFASIILIKSGKRSPAALPKAAAPLTRAGLMFFRQKSFFYCAIPVWCALTAQHSPVFSPGISYPHLLPNLFPPQIICFKHRLHP